MILIEVINWQSDIIEHLRDKFSHIEHVLLVQINPCNKKGISWGELDNIKIELDSSETNGLLRWDL